jgi:hypothetical protein
MFRIFAFEVFQNLFSLAFDSSVSNDRSRTELLLKPLTYLGFGFFSFLLRFP